MTARQRQLFRKLLETVLVPGPVRVASDAALARGRSLEEIARRHASGRFGSDAMRSSR